MNGVWKVIIILLIFCVVAIFIRSEYYEVRLQQEIVAYRAYHDTVAKYTRIVGRLRKGVGGWWNWADDLEGRVWVLEKEVSHWSLGIGH